MNKKNELERIRKTLVENTDECFAVRVESDDTGAHYMLYLVKESIDLGILRAELRSLSLSKRVLIALCDEEFVQTRRENEKE